MPTPLANPPPWYQFSLRSLLLFTLFVAILCSIGVCTHWVVAVAITTLMLGGILGRIVAGTWLGFVAGVLHGILFSLAALVIFVYLPIRSLPWLGDWAAGGLLGIAVLIGGILGGLSVRPRSK